MNIRYLALCTGAVLAAIALQGTSANAMSMTDCSAKYKAAKADGVVCIVDGGHEDMGRRFENLKILSERYPLPAIGA